MLRIGRKTFRRGAPSRSEGEPRAELDSVERGSNGALDLDRRLRAIDVGTRELLPDVRFVELEQEHARDDAADGNRQAADGGGTVAVESNRIAQSAAVVTAIPGLVFRSCKTLWRWRTTFDSQASQQQSTVITTNMVRRLKENQERRGFSTMAAF